MKLLLAGTAAIGAGFVGLSLVASLPLDMVLMFVAGFGVIAMAATTNTTIQL